MMMGLLDQHIKNVEDEIRKNNPERSPALWFVWPPGEELPEIHRSLESASAQADLIARVHSGTKVDIFQLKSVGYIKYPNTPTIYGDFLRP